MAKKKVDNLLSILDQNDTSKDTDAPTYNGRTDLPPELMKQLALRSVGRGPGADSVAIQDAVQASPVPVTLNDIIVAVYDAHGTILKRKNVYSTVKRLIKNGAIARGQDQSTFVSAAVSE